MYPSWFSPRKQAFPHHYTRTGREYQYISKKQIILKKGLGNSKEDTDSSQGVEENGLLGILHYLQIMLRFTNYFTDSF